MTPYEFALWILVGWLLSAILIIVDVVRGRSRRRRFRSKFWIRWYGPFERNYEYDRSIKEKLGL